MNSDILVAAGGTVTIDTEEYRRLVEHNAYLNVILAFVNDPKSYILSDVTCVVDGLVKNDILVIKSEEETPEDTHATEGRDEEAANAK